MGEEVANGLVDDLRGGSVGGQTAETSQVETGSVSETRSVTDAIASDTTDETTSDAVSETGHSGAIDTSETSETVSETTSISETRHSGTIETADTIPETTSISETSSITGYSGAIQTTDTISETSSVTGKTETGLSDSDSVSDGGRGNADTTGGDLSGTSDDTALQTSQSDSFSLSDVSVSLFDDGLNGLGETSVGLNDFVDLLVDRSVHIVDGLLGLVLALSDLDLSGFGRDVLLTEQKGRRFGLEVDSQR